MVQMSPIDSNTEDTEGTEFFRGIQQYDPALTI
jgi:hypothetical protein